MTRGRSISGNSTIAAIHAEHRAAFEKVRHVGAEVARDRAHAIVGDRTRHTRRSARSAAAASLLPPPSPACIGIRLRDGSRRRAARRGGRRPATARPPRARRDCLVGRDSADRRRQSKRSVARRESSACRAARSTERSSAARGSRRAAVPSTRSVRLIFANARTRTCRAALLIDVRDRSASGPAYEAPRSSAASRRLGSARETSPVRSTR